MKVKWYKTPQQQLQADGSEDEEITFGEGDNAQTIKAPKAAVELWRTQGRNQATQAFLSKAMKVKPDEMEIGDNAKPNKIIEQAFGIIQNQAGQIAEYESAKTKTKDKPPEENDDLKKAKEELATRANELASKEADMYKSFAREKALAGILSSAKRDFNLTEESEGLYPGMVENVFDFEVDSGGDGTFSVTFNKKGEGFPFMPGSKPPSSKQLAELIAKQYPGNHSNGVPAGLGSKRTAEPGTGAQKPLNEEKLRTVEERAWSD